jgi:hypothetical protein
MKLASKSACALMLAAAFCAGSANQVSALPMHSLAAASQGLTLSVACKYGSGKCADVKPQENLPSTKKLGFEDPTVDPDCAHYGNCRGGNPEGGSSSAKRNPTINSTGGPMLGGTGGAKISGVEGEAQDKGHSGSVEARTMSSGMPPKPPITAVSPTNSLKLKK